MTITEQRIKEMAESGYPAMIEHHRILKDTGNPIKTYNNSRSKEKYGKKPDYAACGGWTVVRIGRISKPFVAACSKKDHFCFKDGTFLAVSRAYAYFLEHCAEKEQGAALPQEPCKGNCGCCTKDSNYLGEHSFKDGEVMVAYGIAGFDKEGKILGYVTQESVDDLKSHGILIPSALAIDLGFPCNPDSYNFTDEPASFDTIEEASEWLMYPDEKLVKVTATRFMNILIEKVKM